MSETKDAVVETEETTKKKKKRKSIVSEENQQKIKKNWTGFWGEFKKFISKGNVLDMAIGVVIGAAFSKIVTSLVNDIITPVITWLFGKQDLSEFAITLRAATETEKALLLCYGKWLQTIIDFLLVAFCMFMVLRIVMRARTGLKKLTRKEKKELKKAGQELPPPPPPQPIETQEDILRDIRDLLKINNTTISTQIIDEKQ